ncbi:MAG: PAS domain-containing sensor histidine kinase [Planctomycetia bacterium]|nr:PAS domain-containing sensor histidine kinase [Planctomycetia bacterium]
MLTRLIFRYDAQQLMNDPQHVRRYQELQCYVGWTDDDAARVASVGALLDPHLPPLVDDFYAEISRHPDAQKVITGGEAQVARLKTTLVAWLQQLLSGEYDADYVGRRWRVGYRHVEIGLNQVYTNAALSRLRRGLNAVLGECLQDDPARLTAVRQSLMTLIDLDLAIIEDAYQTEYTARQQRIERLATIGQVAGGVAHELRNPLNVVKTSVYYLLNARQANPEKLKDHLQRIGRQVEVADDVISALSDFAKLPVAEQRPTDLAACIGGVLKAEALPSNIATNLSCPATLPRVLVDDKQVRIAFGNLIRNARDAMPDGGRLDIQATGADGHVDIAVSDTGVGIPAEHLRQIMEPFFSTKARGIGLGLALTRAILDKNKGSLRVTSEVGKGSTFVVRLVSAPGSP